LIEINAASSSRLRAAGLGFDDTLEQPTKNIAGPEALIAGARNAG